jgi:Tfp pilus assembly protein PilN
VTQQVNLYRSQFRKQEQKFSARAMLQAAAVVVAGIVLFYGLLVWQGSSLRRESAQLERQHAALTKQIEEVGKKAKPREKSQMLQQEVTRLERELAALAGIEGVLSRGMFTNTRGYSEYLTALARQHVAGLWLTGFDIAGAGERMRLQGRTVDAALVPRYVQRLSAEQTLAGAEFQVFQMTRPDKDKEKNAAPYIEFMIRTAAAQEAARP